MTAVLTLGDELVLPLEAVTQTTAVVGQRGTGKTSTAVVIVEEAHAAGAQVTVIDPTGAWFGLRTSRDGDGPGLDVVVFGGHHGDLPLDPSAGGFLARLVVEQHLSVVLDLELLTKAKQVQLVAEFCETLYHLNRTALTVVIDEAHRFAPQQLRDPGGFGARCLGAVTDVVTLGRRKGLGAVLISQRPAKLNKDVLEQAEILIAHRLKGPNDRKAIRDWLDELGDDAGPALAALPKLERGRAIVHASELDVDGVFQIREKRTFDSSATPEVGAAAIVPRGRADVDLVAIEAAMGETIEAARADDPKVLRARIAELERGAGAAECDHGVEVEMISLIRGITDAAGADAVPFLSDAVASIVGERDRLRVVVQKLEHSAERGLQRAADAERALRDVADALHGHAATLHEADALPVGPLSSSVPPESPARASASPPAASGSPSAGPAPRQRSHPGVSFSPDAMAQGPAQTGGARKTTSSDLTGPQSRVLDAVAWLHAVGFEQPTKIQVGFIAGYRVGKKVGGTFGNVLGQLRAARLLDYPTAGTVSLTKAGKVAATLPMIERSTAGLQRTIMERLSEPEQRVLAAVLTAHPQPATKQWVGAEAGYAVGAKVGGTFGNILGRLRSLGLIDYPGPGHVAATSVLFLGDA